MSTIENVVDDVEGLHSKLDRKSTIESTNKQTAVQFNEVSPNVYKFNCHVHSNVLFLKIHVHIVIIIIIVVIVVIVEFWKGDICSER